MRVVCVSRRLLFAAVLLPVGFWGHADLPDLQTAMRHFGLFVTGGLSPFIFRSQIEILTDGLKLSSKHLRNRLRHFPLVLYALVSS